ncbi:GNAT family N-acetyltransferase [Ideonella paludis]|uniref:GNAT family N-acetyltransferase n=1 Tax=Ideonella paludis TaxID=1233411 RepID=UPI002873C29C|nr:GNAT family N-acetyltransferase [Ideonella paludis]
MQTWPQALSIGLAGVDEPGVLALLEELSATLARLTGDTGAQSFSLDDLRTGGACLAVARDDRGRLWGCGALRPLATEDGCVAMELKRMFARAGTRGVGAALLAFLEAEALGRNVEVIRLSTRRVNERAVRFYRQHGYLPCAPWGRYVGREASVCLEKRLQWSASASPPA